MSKSNINAEIQTYFKGYSARDVATSLAVSSIWPPNLAAPIQHQLLTANFLSIKASDFASSDRISGYDDFKAFITGVYELSPGFPMMEDHVPELDWGEVKYYHDGHSYKFFYGGEFGNTYDLLGNHSLVFSSLDKEYHEQSGASPVEELATCLKLQEFVIENVTTKPSQAAMRQLDRGALVVPSRQFWRESVETFEKLPYYLASDPAKLDGYILELGSYPEANLKESVFSDLAWTGNHLLGYFVTDGKRFYPLLPRRSTAVLIARWAKLFEQFGDAVLADSKSTYQDRMTAEIGKYIRKRLPRRDSQYFVSASDGQAPDDAVFSAALLGKSKLILVYALPPFATEPGAKKALDEARPILERNLAILRKQPTTLYCQLEMHFMQFAPAHPGEVLEPVVMVVMPQVTAESIPIPIPKDYPGRAIFLDQALALFDEVEDGAELAEFLSYADDNAAATRVPFITVTDLYGSFKDASGVLIEGAIHPDMIMLDPHWGSDWRLGGLKKFWAAYPDIDLNSQIEPREWTAKFETETRIRMQMKQSGDMLLVFKAGQAYVICVTSLHDMAYEAASLCNLVMECLEDYFARFPGLLISHPFFMRYKFLQINVFSSTMLDNPDLTHISHLKPGATLWRMDHGKMHFTRPAIRMVINDQLLSERLEASTTNDVEVDLVSDILLELDSFEHSSTMGKLLEQVEQLKGEQPRFKVFHEQKSVAFPEHERNTEIGAHEHKLARKRVAELALKAGLKPGTYSKSSAQGKLNQLKTDVVALMNDEVAKYSLDQATPVLIREIDGLTNHYDYLRRQSKRALQHQVDYDRKERYANNQDEFISQHKCYRYLIEKFVQLQPTGSVRLTGADTARLAALADKIYEIQAASDAIHYDVYPVKVRVTRDIVIITEHAKKIDEQSKQVSELTAQIKLGTVGQESDRVSSPTPLETFLGELDVAFKQDFGFGLKDLVNFLQILSEWAFRADGVAEAAYYHADLPTLLNVYSRSIDDEVKPEEVERIADFLTLIPGEVLRINGQPQPAADLPIWEHVKRQARYGIKPIVKIGTEYYWGPFSAQRSAHIWTSTVNQQQLPSDFPGKNVQAALRTEGAIAEKAIENKALEIARRHTVYADRVNYSRGTHPQEIGEYDTLAYLEEANILLNIECKDILQAYTLKDSKRLREKIFRLDGTNKGNLIKVEDREKYLSEHIDKFRDVLKWPIRDDAKIASLYVSRDHFWWTLFPPRPTTVQFIRIDMLDEAIRKLTDA